MRLLHMLTLQWRTAGRIRRVAGGLSLLDNCHAAQVEATKVRLLQIDVAVKDSRADPAGGWVFGTFQYDNSVKAASPWRRVTPVALMWGDDPGLTPTMYKEGARPVASWVNPDAPVAVYRAAQPAGSEVPSVMGWAGYVL